MRRPPLMAQMILVGLIGVAILLPIALLVVPWFPRDASTQASNIHTLYDVLLIASVPIFVIVETVVVFSVWKFRLRPGDEDRDGPPIHGNTRLEVAWTVAPALLLVGLCAYAYSVLRSNEKNHSGAMVVNVTERQFTFEFSYPRNGSQQVVSPVLYLPKGQPVVFHLRSLDVVHSFFVPEFSEKLDAVPGIVTTLRVTPTRLGSYPAECTELCGAGHGLMRAPVDVVTPARFRAWMSGQKPGGAPPVGAPPANAAQPGVPGSAGASGGTGASSASGPSGGAAGQAGGAASSSPSASTGRSTASGAAGSSTSASSSGAAGGSANATPAAGKAIFTGAGTCGSCHTLAAAGTTGTVGPNLTQRLKSDCATAKSRAIRGKTLQQCIYTAITKPYAYIPTGFSPGIMPPNFAQRLSPTQIKALVNFLASVTK